MEMKEALAAFTALGQPMRLAVFRLLVREGPDGLAAGTIARRLGVKPNSLSPNLAALVHAGLVGRTRTGRSLRYAANMDGVADLLAYLMEDCCAGRPELCRPAIAEIATMPKVFAE